MSEMRVQSAGIVCLYRTIVTIDGVPLINETFRVGKQKKIYQSPLLIRKNINSNHRRSHEKYSEECIFLFFFITKSQIVTYSRVEISERVTSGSPKTRPTRTCLSSGFMLVVRRIKGEKWLVQSRLGPLFFIRFRYFSCFRVPKIVVLFHNGYLSCFVLLVFCISFMKLFLLVQNIFFIVFVYLFVY